MPVYAKGNSSKNKRIFDEKDFKKLKFNMENTDQSGKKPNGDLKICQNFIALNAIAEEDP